MKEKSSINIAEETAGVTAKRLTELYSKEVVAGSFKGYPVVMFKDQVFNEDGSQKVVSHYP